MLCVQLIESIDYASRGRGQISTAEREKEREDIDVLLSCVSAMTASILSEMSTLVERTSEMDQEMIIFAGGPTISEAVRRLWRCGLSRGR